MKIPFYKFAKQREFILTLPVTILNGVAFYEDLAKRKTQYRDDFFPHTFYSFGCLTNISDFFPYRTAPVPTPERKTEDDFKRYDNFNAIHISSLWCLPEHTNEIMGVPATFFQYDYKGKYEVLGRVPSPRLNGKQKYTRILIKEK